MSPRALTPGAVRVDRLWKRFRVDAARHRFGVDESRRLISHWRGDHAEGWRWVLHDVSFDIAPGESVGIVGVNGSGKSTLLKMIAGVVHPYAGSVRTVGAIGAIMDVGATVQSALTGRENVVLYGRMQGLSYRQIRARTDEILEFAGLTDAADRLVKHYSSGMNVRLGFALASHVEAPILIVDEALAVGDADFKRKCMQRMRELVDGGATLLFVSHGLEQVQAMCRRTLWLEGGGLRADGESAEVIAHYRESLDETRTLPGDVVSIRTDLTTEPAEIDRGGTLTVHFVLGSDEARSVDLTVGVSVGEIDPFVTVTHRIDLGCGDTAFSLSVHDLSVAAGSYPVLATITDPAGSSLAGWRSIGRVRVLGERLGPTPTGVARTSPFLVASTVEMDR
ncbi:MAG: ABC transporter ATP-binding protein [Acidimicrobiia bacterium]|nr:ABC transporter ATP-binding protein [Acidimicrobiia bacterium]